MKQTESTEAAKAPWRLWLWLGGGLALGVWSGMMWELHGADARLQQQLRDDVAALEAVDRELADRIELMRLTANREAARAMAEDHAREALRQLQPQLEFNPPIDGPFFDAGIARKETER